MSAGIATIFIHGIGGAAAIWREQETAFAAAGFDPVAIDLPGYGGRPSITPMTVETLAVDVEDLIAQRGLKRPILIGHSLGGMIAQTMLRRKPDGYRAAVLSCTSPAFGNPAGDFQKKFIADRLAPFDAGGTMQSLAAQMMAAMVGPQPDPKGVALGVETIAATPDATFRDAVHCLVSFDERANLGAIRVPVLCLAGEADRNAPASMMEKMAGKIPGARYICLKSVGHMPNVEAPKAFDEAILGFLKSLPH
jgi:3-oxoadipate enol-lactonase